MKTKARVKENSSSNFRAGEIGYIDGYLKGTSGGGTAFAVLVCDKMVDVVPVYSLEIITEREWDERNREIEQL